MQRRHRARGRREVPGGAAGRPLLDFSGFTHRGAAGIRGGLSGRLSGPRPTTSRSISSPPPALGLRRVLTAIQARVPPGMLGGRLVRVAGCVAPGGQHTVVGLAMNPCPDPSWVRRAPAGSLSRSHPVRRSRNPSPGPCCRRAEAVPRHPLAHEGADDERADNPRERDSRARTQVLADRHRGGVLHRRGQPPPLQPHYRTVAGARHRVPPGRRVWPAGRERRHHVGQGRGRHARSGTWSAAWPAPPGSSTGPRSPHTRCGIPPSPSPWTPAPPCAACKILPVTTTLEPLGVTTGTGTAWTATPPTPSPPTWPD